jgi:hypothetical protein
MGGGAPAIWWGETAKREKAYRPRSVSSLLILLRAIFEGYEEEEKREEET